MTSRLKSPDLPDQVFRPKSRVLNLRLRECDYCFPILEFYDHSEFARHLRTVHATKEGGSYVCRYGENNVCQKLPLEGVSDVDYEAHIRRFHSTDSAPSPLVPSVAEVEEDDGEAKKNKFSINSYAQNLSSVLLDPSRKSETATFFTRHWGDGFVAPTSVPVSRLIPPVSASHFATYTKVVGKIYKQYKAAKKSLEKQKADEDKADADDLPSVFVDPSFLLSHGPTFTTIFTVPAVDQPDSLAITVKGKKVIREEKPSERNEADAPPGSFRNYESLHNRLESMHEVVDARLASKLVSKSDAFWHMVHSYGGLHEELAEAMADIRRVRSNLKSVSSVVCERTKRVVRLHEIREQKEKLLIKLKDIACLRNAQSTVQMMLNQSDYPKAIDCIETSQEVLTTELNGVQCFRHLSSQLNELYGAIGRMMREDFAQLIQKEFGSRVEDPTQIINEGELSSVMMGLMQVRTYSFIHVLRSEIGEALKSVMRVVVKASIVQSGMDLTEFDPTLSQLGDPVRRLQNEEWLKTVQAVMDALFSFCIRLQALQEIACDLADRVSQLRESEPQPAVRDYSSPSNDQPLQLPSDGTSSEQDDSFGSIPRGGNKSSPSADPSALMSVEIRSDFQLRKVVGLIAEYGHQCAQNRLCRLLMARAKDSYDNTTPQQLAEVLSLVRTYQQRCSDQGWHRTQPTAASPLSSCLHKMSIDYIEKFHNQRRAKMGEVLDMELWKAAEVPAVFQSTMDYCIRENRLRNVSSSDTTTSNTLIVDGQEYVVVGSALIFVRILADYCECVAHLPVFVADILSRIVELMKAFNSRCCQLILGAGALQLVGLKTISVRNLALASRSLQLIVYLVPIVSSEIQTYLKDDQQHLMRHFKQVLSDYADHVSEITAKLVSVIDHHTMNCLASWDVKGSIPSASFQLICRQMAKFHNGLAGIMPDAQIRGLFEMVHSHFKDNLKMKLAQIGISPHDALTYGYVSQEYTYYVESIQAMSCCTDMQFESLNEVVYGR